MVIFNNLVHSFNRLILPVVSRSRVGQHLKNAFNLISLQCLQSLLLRRRRLIHHVHLTKKIHVRFILNFFCNKSNDKSYIKSQTDNFNNVKVGVHSGHLQIQPDHIPNKIVYLSDEGVIFINNCLKEQRSLSRISNMTFYTVQNSATR